MSAAPAPLRHLLGRLAAAGGTLSAGELARDLLALAHPVEEGLGRRLIAAALQWPLERLPERLEADALARLARGPGLDQALERADFVVVDLETTGLSVDRAHILEIGAVRVRGLRAVDRFETLVDPGGPIPHRITALTGIDSESVEGAPRLREAMAGFRSWLARSPGAPFVAHNARFDRSFVERGLARLELPPLERPVLCTRRLSRRLLPELGRYSLDALCAHLGISNAARHRALGDARATAQALVQLVRRALERPGLRQVGDLLELQTRPPAPLRGRPDRVAARGGR